jgi:glycosyltransferase involved in cell wall biosynthesis
VITPDVSLVMPVWQVPQPWLHEAVSSALAEDACAIEVVVVDDGNDDPVADRLREVADERLRVVRIAHAGQGPALDAGIAAARGRYLRFVDADDVVVPHSTSRLLRLADGRTDVIAYGATVVCDEALNPVRTISSSIAGDATVPCLLGLFEVRHVAMLFPRAVVEHAGTWSAGMRVSGDWDFVLRALELATVVGDGEPAVLYRRHARSLTGAADVETGERDRERVIDRFLERNPHQRGTSLERRARAALFLDRALAYAAVGDTRCALDRLRRAAPLAPGRTARAAVRVVTLRARRALGRRRGATA